MKLFLAVLLAAVWSTTAAPQSTPRFSFQEYGLDLPFFENFDQVEEVLKCVQTAIVEVIAESELGPVWDETIAKVNHLVSNEWPKCASHTDKYKKLKCQTTVAKNLVDAVNVFVTELAKINKWELAQEIKEKVLTLCFSKSGLMIDGENEIEELGTNVIRTFLSRFECLATSLGEVSKALGLNSLWENSQPQLEHHLSKWKQCQQIENGFARYVCESKEAVASYATAIEYVRLAAAQQPKFIEAFDNYYVEHCSENSFDDKMTEIFAVEEFSTNGDYYERFECVAESLNTLSNTHGLESLWSEYQTKIEHHLGQWQACSKASNPVFVAICQAREAVQSFIYITKYMKLACNEDPTFAEAFADYYNKNCARNSNADEFSETSVMNGLEACIKKLLERINCVTNVITETVHGSDIENVWTEAYMALMNLQNKLAQCTSSNEPAKCIYETLKESYSVFAEFLKHLKEAHSDAYNQIMENIKNKCYTA